MRDHSKPKWVHQNLEFSVCTIKYICFDLIPCVAEFVKCIIRLFSQDMILHRRHNIDKYIILQNKQKISTFNHFRSEPYIVSAKETFWQGKKKLSQWSIFQNLRTSDLLSNRVTWNELPSKKKMMQVTFCLNTVIFIYWYSDCRKECDEPLSLSHTSLPISATSAIDCRLLDYQETKVGNDILVQALLQTFQIFP